jgi:hypothetical protein
VALLPQNEEFEIQKWRLQEYAAIVLLLFLFATAVASNNKTIAVWQKNSTIKVSPNTFMLYFYETTSTGPASPIVSPQFGQQKSRMVSSSNFDPPFKKSNRVPPPFFSASYNQRGLKWIHPASN